MTRYVYSCVKWRTDRSPFYTTIYIPSHSLNGNGANRTRSPWPCEALPVSIKFTHNTIRHYGRLFFYADTACSIVT